MSSVVAARVLENWRLAVGEFRAVVPRDYQRAIRVIHTAQAAGRDIDESIMAELAAPATSPPPGAPGAGLLREVASRA